MDYNYVIVGSDGYYNVGYHDLMTLDNVRYFSSMYDGISSSISKKMIRCTFSKKINKYLSYPFSCHTYSRLFPFKFDNNKPVVFIFFGHTQHIYQSGYLEYLRKKYQNVKLVLYMQDIIARNTYLKFDKVKSKFDLILSYDKGDSEKYGLNYYPTPYSNYPIYVDSNIEDIDVFYCGHAKMRYKEIFYVYKKCVEKGLKCKFFITAVPKNERIESNDIIYDRPISYIENLQYVLKSKCILEVMQINADGYTPRLWESIMYDKHLLTNNKCVFNSKYYNNETIHNILDIENILLWIDSPIIYSDQLKLSLSPINLLYRIEELL